MICDYCNNTIFKNSNIYKGFDMDFCSVHCRINVSKQIYKFDPKTMNYNKWSSLYNKPENHENSPLKKTHSIRKNLSSDPIIYNTENVSKEPEKISNKVNNINEIYKNLFENDFNKMDYYFYDYTISLTRCKSFELLKNILETRPIKYILSYMFDNY